MYRTIIGLIAMLPVTVLAAPSIYDTWQLQTHTSTEVVVDETPQSSTTPRDGTEFLTFNRNKTVTGTEWIISDYLSGLLNVGYAPSRAAFFGPVLSNRAPYATFRPKGARYTISYDIGRINARQGSSTLKMTDPWLKRSDYLILLNTALAASPTVTKSRITEYSHQGQIDRPRQAISGTVTIKYELSLTVNSAAKTAIVTLTTAYTGSRFPVKSACCDAADTVHPDKNALISQRNALASQAFLDAVAALPGIQTTPSGLKYLMLQEGSGNTATATSKVVMNYKGFFPSGQVFDAGVCSRASLASDTIQGRLEGLQLMKLNAKARFFIPASLAYGDDGQAAIANDPCGNVYSVGPKSALVFDIELIDLK